MNREWNASAYHRLSDPQFGWGMAVLARAPLQGNETILDAGCGTGRITTELMQRLPQGRVIAVDLSQNMLRTARATLAPYQGRVSFVCADLQRLPFRERFDGVFSTATFHWAKDHPRLFASLFDALRPGGWLVAQCGGGPNLQRHRQRARALMASPRFARYFQDWTEPWNYATPEATAERLLAAGFTAIETWLEPAGFALPDPDTFKQFLATVTLHRHVAAIPDAPAKDEFLNEMVRQSCDDPEFTLDYWRLNITARRP